MINLLTGFFSSCIQSGQKLESTTRGVLKANIKCSYVYDVKNMGNGPRHDACTDEFVRYALRASVGLHYDQQFERE